MQENDRRVYTILIYANGNNEFEPEIGNLMQQVQAVGSNKDTHVVIQTGRIEQQVLEIIRPSYGFDGASKDESGVKRYYLTMSEAVVVEDLGKTNMASPISLFNFIKWGMETYPSQHCILVLGGHVYQFVGLGSDLSQNSNPYIMGFPELSTALSMVSDALKQKIDLLVLDTCYINTIEVLYELGKEAIPPVKTVLTYIYKGPFSGLPYDIFLKLVQEYCNTENTNFMVEKIIDIMDMNLIAFEINHQILNILKKLFNDLAYHYMTNRGDLDLKPNEIFACYNTSLWYGIIGYVRDIASYSEQLVINHSKTQNVQGNITFAQMYMSDCKQPSLYNRLAFSRENYWTKLLSIKLTDHNILMREAIQQEPMIIPTPVLYYYISVLNPGFNPEKNRAILKELYDFKKWEFVD